MYSRKKVELGMEPCRTPTLTGYSFEDFLPSRTTQGCLLLKGNEAKYLTWNSVRLKFEEDQHIKTCQKSWIYQALQLE